MKPGAPWVWTLTQAALAALKTVLVASRALQGLEGVCEAVSEHRHLASVADTAREEAKASAGGALVRMLHSLGGGGRTRTGSALAQQRHQPPCLPALWAVTEQCQQTTAEDLQSSTPVTHQRRAGVLSNIPFMVSLMASAPQAWCVKAGTC